jgi:Domain of unknown function (DUF4126)
MSVSGPQGRDPVLPRSLGPSGSNEDSKPGCLRGEATRRSGAHQCVGVGEPRSGQFQKPGLGQRIRWTKLATELRRAGAPPTSTKSAGRQRNWLHSRPTFAGTIVSAAVMTDVPPMVKWTAAVIAGGGIAGITQGVTATLRANSTIWTGGLGNLALSAALSHWQSRGHFGRRAKLLSH